MNAHTLKTAAMCWLRYGRQLTHVGSEIGYFSSDVLGANEDKMYEIETKISRVDLRKDFTKPKHELYKNEKTKKHGVPNYFYFLVPEFLKDYAIQLCNEHNPKLGVLVYRESDGPLYRLADRLTVAKKAGKLHDQKPKPAVLEGMAKRLSSDLCSYYLHRFADEAKWKELMDVTKTLCDTKDLDANDEAPKDSIVVDDSPPLPVTDAAPEIAPEALVESLEPDWMGYEPSSKYEAVRDGIRVGLEYRMEEIEKLKAELAALKMSAAGHSPE